MATLITSWSAHPPPAQLCQHQRRARKEIRTYQTLQMLHEHLQTDIVCEDSLAGARARSRAIHARGHVRRTGVELGEQETGL